jgi:hypothetical protein
MGAVSAITAVSTLFAGGAPRGVAEQLPEAPPIEFTDSAKDNPVNGPNSELFPQSNHIVHIGGMGGMMDLSENNIFHYLATLPEEERVLKIGLISPESPPEWIQEHGLLLSEYEQFNQFSFNNAKIFADHFESVAGIEAEVIVKTEANADEETMIDVVALNHSWIERQQAAIDSETDPEKKKEMGIAAGYKGDWGVLPNSHISKKIVFAEQSNGGIGLDTLTHEIAHALGLDHKGKGATLGEFKNDETITYDLMPFQQHAISTMNGSYSPLLGPADIYWIRAAMRKAGLNPPAAEAEKINLAKEADYWNLVDKLTPDGEDSHYPALSLQVKDGSVLTGTNQSDLLVSEDGLCGLQRYQVYLNEGLYCIVEGDFGSVKAGDGNDLILTSRLKNQVIDPGEGEDDIAIIDKNSGEKTIRHDMSGDGGNNLVFHWQILKDGHVEARQKGDSIVLDFINQGKCTSRITLVDQLKRSTEPVIENIKVMFNYEGFGHSLEASINISQARTAADFEELFDHIPDYIAQSTQRAVEKFPELKAVTGKQANVSYGDIAGDLASRFQDVMAMGKTPFVTDMTFIPTGRPPEEPFPMPGHSAAAVFDREKKMKKPPSRPEKPIPKTSGYGVRITPPSGNSPQR